MAQPTPVPTLAYEPPAADDTPRRRRAAAIATVAVGSLKAVHQTTFWASGGGAAWFAAAGNSRANAVAFAFIAAETVVAALLVAAGVAVWRGHSRARPTLALTLGFWAVLILGGCCRTVAQRAEVLSVYSAGTRIPRTAIAALNAAAADLQVLVLPALLWWLVGRGSARQMEMQP